MSETFPNGVLYRLTRLEEQVKQLHTIHPEVIAERVGMLSVRVNELRLEFEKDMQVFADELKSQREELGSQRKILISFFASFALVAILIVIAYVATGTPAG